MADLEQKRSLISKDLSQKQETNISPVRKLSNLKKPGKPEGFLDKALGYGKGNTIIDVIINKLAHLLETIRDWLLGTANNLPKVQRKRKKLQTNEDEK